MENYAPTRARQACPRPHRLAFTLVELLVVIGIIALLISILLPALNRARRSANSLKCSSNLRTLMQGVLTYAAENRGAIPGSGWTTGAYMMDRAAGKVDNTVWTANNTWGVFQPHDWAGPIAKYIKISFDDSAGSAQRTARFNILRNNQLFRCPDNDFEAIAFGAPDYGAGPMFSYNSAIAFVVQARRLTVDSVTRDKSPQLYAPEYWTPPVGYNVTMSKVGTAAKKIFLADGARYVAPGKTPTYDASLTGNFGGLFADQGAFSKESKSWNRAFAPGNDKGTTEGIDTRVYAFRHGSKKLHAKPDEYKANFAFFDGHVEVLGDLEASNPVFWLPRGSTIANVSSELNKDAFDKYVGTAPTGDIFTIRE